MRTTLRTVVARHREIDHVYPSRRRLRRFGLICLAVSAGAFAGLPLLWLGILAVLGLAVWGCVAAVENLREAQEIFDEITLPLGE
jgi:hypothetical protein